jgi:leucyl aminopeptidase
MTKISFAVPQNPATKTLILTVEKDGKFGLFGAALDKKMAGGLRRAVKESSFTGGFLHNLEIVAPAKTKFARIFLLGLGDVKNLDVLKGEALGGAVTGLAASAKVDTVSVMLDDHKAMKVTDGSLAVAVATGLSLKAYRFDKYRTKTGDKTPSLKSATIHAAAEAKAKKLWPAAAAVIEAVKMSRDLVSEPANVIYPVTLAEHCKSLKSFGLHVEVLDEKQMKKLGMNTLLGVAQGSANPPRLVMMEWRGNPGAKDKSPLALVGKGVTFDSGGISIKPAGGMEEMKWDMGGSAAVIGAMQALAARKAKVNVVGVVALVENMPSGTAQRPGDVVTSMSGQTVEVINTDAEGRLILADAVWHTVEKYKPHTLIDLATLTGAIIVALGDEYAGLFANDDALADKLLKSSATVDEKIWRMPLCDQYDKDINSDIADMKNVGAAGKAGSAAGAVFIQRFVKKGVAWAHLDIAGVAWMKRDKPTVPKGATAFGVRLLNQFVADHFEAK